MIQTLLNFYRLNKKAIYDYKNKDIDDLKTGISTTERKRLHSSPAFEEGIAHFFGKSFKFSHGPSFVHSADEIFGEEIYKFNADTETPYILDCGANIGLSLYYFKKFYPKARIVAFEPDEKIFKILEENIFNLPNSNNVTLEKKAVWKEYTELQFFSEGALAGSLVTDFGNKNNIIKIQAVDLKGYLNEPIDFLKIDIEGAENELIFDIRNHLKNVRNMFLEYHGILGQPQNLGEILNLLKEAGFQYYIRLAGETIRFPFCGEKPRNFNQQLNILCYR